jgi:hypothetical protein
MNMDLQLFGGGKGGSTTTVQSPAPTAQELRLQDVQANYAEKTAPTALALQNMGANMVLSNPGVVPVDYTQMGQSAVQGARNLQGQSANLGNNIAGIGNASNNAYNQATGNLSSLANKNAYNQSTGNQAYNNLSNLNNGQMSTNSNSMNGLFNGQIPQAFLDNQRAIINSQLEGTMGNSVNNLMKRGVLGNSSATASDFYNVGRGVENSVMNNFNNNIATLAGLQNQNYNQQQQGFQNQAGITGNQNSFAQQGYGNNVGLYDAANQAAQQNISNQSNMYNQQSNNIAQQSGLLSQPMALANSAQNASIDIPAKLLALSQGQQVNTSDLLNTLSANRINDKTTTQTIESPGLLSGLVGLGTAYYGSKRR